jgi:hypothetical protein
MTDLIVARSSIILSRLGGFLGMLVPVLVVGSCDGGPTPSGDRMEFDRQLADTLVQRQVAFGPRVPGTTAHAEALAWMTTFLEARADVTEQMPFTHVTQEGETLSLTNVWASFKPEVTSRVLVIAHWDTRPVAERAADVADRDSPIPGANDGASGVAIVLAIADALAERPPEVGVDLLLTDGEDWGHDPVTLATFTPDMFLGARHFAEVRGDTYRPLYGILLDLVGDHEPRFPREGFSLQFAPSVVRRVWDLAQELGYGAVFIETIGQPNIIDFDYPFWHTPEDTVDKVSSATLEIVGDVVLTTIRRQGGQ